jgi:small basic protein (TIGR04137 family)
MPQRLNPFRTDSFALPYSFCTLEIQEVLMSIDKSLRRKGGMAQIRSVLSRVERITKMKELDKWQEGMSPFGLPKTRVFKVVIKKVKKAKVEGEGVAGAPGAPAAAGATPPPVAGAAAAKGAAPAKAAAPAKKEDKKK